MNKSTLSDLILTIRSLYEKLLGPSKSPTELSRRAVSKPRRTPVKTVKVPAVKKTSGKVVKAKSKQQSHDDLKTEGQRGFILSDGKFAGREEAATVAKKAKQVPKTVKKLHSEDLRKKKK